MRQSLLVHGIGCRDMAMTFWLIRTTIYYGGSIQYAVMEHVLNADNALEIVELKDGDGNCIDDRSMLVVTSTNQIMLPVFDITRRICRRTIQHHKIPQTERMHSLRMHRSTACYDLSHVDSNSNIKQYLSSLLFLIENLSASLFSDYHPISEYIRIKRMLTMPF